MPLPRIKRLSVTEQELSDFNRQGYRPKGRFMLEFRYDVKFMRLERIIGPADNPAKTPPIRIFDFAGVTP